MVGSLEVNGSCEKEEEEEDEGERERERENRENREKSLKVFWRLEPER